MGIDREHSRVLSRRQLALAGAAWLAPRLAAQKELNGKGARDLSVSASEQPGPDKSTAGAPRRLALLIGNNGYTSAPRLQNAVNDAADLGGKLIELGFTVNVVTDGTLADVNTTISRHVSNLRPGDISLFFYAGHGVQSGGENYLLPVDFQPSSGEASLPAACIGASSVLDRLQRSGPELNLMILDACRNNPFHPGADAEGLAVMEAGLGACISLSTGPGQTAADNPRGRNGLFSGFLLANIETPGQSLDALLKRVKLQVYDASGGIQRSWMFADIVGDFFFRPAAQITAPRGGVLESVEVGKQFLQRGQYERPRHRSNARCGWSRKIHSFTMRSARLAPDCGNGQLRLACMRKPSNSGLTTRPLTSIGAWLITTPPGMNWRCRTSRGQ